MRFILGLIIFWLSIFGINKFIENKFKIEKNFTFVLSFTLIGITIFMAGILNVIKLTSILLTTTSIAYIIRQIYKKRINIKEELIKLKNPNFIIMAILFIYITIIGYNMHITHYDNFSHWGLIVKNMFITDALPNFESLITFKGYQPGSACFIYYFSLLCGKTETSMIIAQNYLILAFLTPLLYFIKGNNKNLKRTIFITFYLFIMSASIRFNDLLVDSLIATMAISSLSIIYYYRNNLKKSFLYSLPISIYLLLVKNTGLLLAGISCLALLMYSYKNKELKKGIKYVIITGIILLFTLIIWQNHVKLVFGELALNSKHSMTTENIILQLRTKGWDKIFIFIKDYIMHLFTLKNNNANIYILIINFILVTLLFTDKSKRKQILGLLGITNILYLGYYCILGVMYLLSMPWEEAVTFAGYERYMMTILIIIIGIIFIYLFKHQGKTNLKAISILITALLLSTLYIYKDNANALIGKENYKNTFVERYDKIIEKIPIEKEKNYYIYSPSSENDFSFMYYLTRYKLNVPNVEVIHNKDEIEKNQSGIFVFIEEDENIKKYLEKNDWKKKNKIVYTK